MRALLFGERVDLLESVPALLSRAGFDVCLISTAAVLKNCRHVDRFIEASSTSDLIAKALEEAALGYELIVPGDDRTLISIKQAEMPIEDKVRLLPVTCAAGVEHIASKVGLSRRLKAGAVRTPEFRIANTRAELDAAIGQIGFPLLVKADFGAGGSDVHEFVDQDTVARDQNDYVYPVVVQKKVTGKHADLSGFFADGIPIFFAYSISKKTQRDERGPDSIRCYVAASNLDPAVTDVMRNLGSALFIDGFANISCIESDVDGQLYFFEADLRPNVWVEYPKYFGEDPAVKLRRFFAQPQRSKPEAERASAEALCAPSEPKILSYLPRLNLYEILSNASGCRQYYENYLSRNIVFMGMAGPVEKAAFKYLKPMVPDALRRVLRRTRSKLFVQ